METSKLLDYFEDRRARILENIRALVEIESPSYDVAGSHAAVSFLAQEAEKLSCVASVERIVRENYGEHLLIRAFQTEDAGVKPILLLGHTDTVHPRGARLQNPTRVEGEKMFGGGVFDMKANCVLTVEILRAFEELNLKPARPVTIFLSCDEEVGSPTGRELVEREASKSAYCLVCEPSANGKVKTGRKGTGNYKLKARGVPAHAGLEPEKGASAILELARQIPLIHALSDYEKGTTVNVCLIGGGTASNVIPEFAECAIDVRFTSTSEAERVENAINGLHSFEERVTLEITGEINRPPLERNEKTLALYKQAREVAERMNYEFGETQVGGASDGNFVAALGVPVLDGLGVRGDGAHTMHEHIIVADIPKRAALVSSLVLDYRP